jgi:hypothetical protein
MLGDKCRSPGVGHGELCLLQRLRSSAPKSPCAGAAMLAEEARQATKMVVMAMAQHKRIQPSGVNVEETGVVDQRFRCVAEVHENVARLGPMSRVDVHRQTDLLTSVLPGGLSPSPQPKR